MANAYPSAGAFIDEMVRQDTDRDSDQSQQTADRTREYLQRERLALQTRFGDAYARLEALLFEEDPIEINFGYNTDEYDPEVDTILPRLGSCRTTLEVQEVVHAEFLRWFGTEAGPLSRYQRIAERIVTELPGMCRLVLR